MEVKEYFGFFVPDLPPLPVSYMLFNGVRSSVSNGTLGGTLQRDEGLRCPVRPCSTRPGKAPKGKWNLPLLSRGRAFVRAGATVPLLLRPGPGEWVPEPPPSLPSWTTLVLFPDQRVHDAKSIMAFTNLPHSFVCTYCAAHGSPEPCSQVNRPVRLTAVTCSAVNMQMKLAAQTAFGTLSTSIQAPNMRRTWLTEYCHLTLPTANTRKSAVKLIAPA